MGAAAFGVLSVLEHRHDLSAVVLPMTHAPFALAIVFLSVVASVLSYLALNRALEVLPVAAILVGIWGVQRFAAPTVPDTAESTEPLPPS